jgi:hypothetical protein
MQLIKVYANKSSFKTVEFNKTGLSFMLSLNTNLIRG